MTEYVRPEFYVTEFQAGEAVTVCEASSSYEPVRVDCLIKSGDVDGVFYSGGCSYVASENNLVTIDANDEKYRNTLRNVDGFNQNTDYAANSYFYWYGSSSGSPENGKVRSDGVITGSALMNVLIAMGISRGNSNNVLHAGLATPTVLSVINSST